MHEKDIIKRCKELGCCNACCLRFLGIKSPAAYENAKTFILKYEDIRSKPQDAEVKPNLGSKLDEEIQLDSQKQPKSEPENKTSAPKEENDKTTETDVVNNAHGTANTASADEKHFTEGTVCDDDPNSTDGSAPPSKKLKIEHNSVCISCIGILQEENWPQCYDMVKDMLSKKRYECPTFACALSAPIATILRERVVALHLKEAFKNYDDCSLTPLKEAWKWSFGAGLAPHAGKALHSGAVAPLLVTVTVEYPDDLQELEILKTLSSNLFESRSRQRRRFTVEFTRRSVEQALAGVTLSAVRARPGWQTGAPPVRARPACVSVVCAHVPLYLGGRYIKLSRSLPQTPWLVNGRRMMHSSVQEIICEPIASLYRMSAEQAEHRLKFMSAGREDVDVRCLGDGRPFAVEVTDPARQPTDDELRQLCEQISQSGHVVVKSLLPVSREDLTQLKKGEESKCKTYEALCIKLSHSQDDELTADADAPVVVTARDLRNINTYSNVRDHGGARVLLQQRTPVRVLHRRPLLTRARRILELSAHAVPQHPQLFVVRIRTEAGTYVKEWAHGEAGRTRPRLGDALRARADILALDVAAVELQWPPSRTA